MKILCVEIHIYINFFGVKTLSSKTKQRRRKLYIDIGRWINKETLAPVDKQ